MEKNIEKIVVVVKKVVMCKDDNCFFRSVSCGVKDCQSQVDLIIYNVKLLGVLITLSYFDFQSLLKSYLSEGRHQYQIVWCI